MSLPTREPLVAGAHETLPTARILGPGEGEHLWFLGTLMTVKAGGDITGGNLSVIEATMPPGFGPPLHRHDVEDELFFVIEGEMTFWCAGQQATHGAGATVWLPKGLPHRFQVGDAGPARMLQISTPAQFEDFARSVGEPAAAPCSPSPRRQTSRRSCASPPVSRSRSCRPRRADGPAHNPTEEVVVPCAHASRS